MSNSYTINISMDFWKWRKEGEQDVPEASYELTGPDKEYFASKFETNVILYNQNKYGLVVLGWPSFSTDLEKFTSENDATVIVHYSNSVRGCDTWGSFLFKNGARLEQYDDQEIEDPEAWDETNLIMENE